MKKQLFKLFLFTVLLVLGNSGIIYAYNDALQPLVSPELLKAGKLQMLWQNKLPMQENESIEKLYILDNRIYALSSQNYLVSLNRETGEVIFSRPLVKAGLPVVGFNLYKEEIFSIAGNKLIQINTEFGSDLSVKGLKFGAACPAARNNSFFYIASTDTLMHILRADDKVRTSKISAQNNSVITSILADEKFVIFATSAGNCIRITTDASNRLWQFDAADSIVEPIVRDGNFLYFASSDTNLYKLNLLNGKLVWKYQTGAELKKSPTVTENLVYQYVSDKGLLAINKKTGQFEWRLAEGLDLLTETNGKAYVITNRPTLTVMSNEKNMKMYSVNFADTSRYAVNTVDSKIYIAAKDGRISCINPIE